MATNDTPGAGETKHKAGLFDIRFIIGSLLGIYGVILLVAGFFTSAAQKAKADGLNANLYTGIFLIVVALGFAIWTRVRPIVVPEHVDEDGPADS